MATLAGKSGSINLGAAAYAFREWTVDMQTDAIDVTSFSSSGYKENIAGLTSAKISARGPFNSTAMAVTAGSSYAFVLFASGSVSYSINARITSIRVVTEVSKAVEVDISAESTGSFTAAIA